MFNSFFSFIDGLSEDSGETEVTETIEQSNKGVIHVKCNTFCIFVYSSINIGS